MAVIIPFKRQEDSPMKDDTPKAPVINHEIVFHYSRDHRLERASPAVRELNNPNGQKRPGLFKTLTATRSHAFLLVSIITLSIFMIMVSILSDRKDTSALGGNILKVEAMRFEGATFIVIHKTIKTSLFKTDMPVYTGMVDMAIRPQVSAGEKKAGVESPIATQRIFFSLNEEEEYRFSVPFEASTLFILMQAESERIMIKVQAE
jgi:hypothetical protein